MRFFTQGLVLSFILWFSINFSANAQNSFGLKLGPNLSSQVGNYIIPNNIPEHINYSFPDRSYSFKLGFHLGGYFRFQKENSKFRIQAEYLYNLKGYKSRTSRTSTQGNNGVLSPPSLDGSSSNEYSEAVDHLHYFSIPLYFNYMSNKFGIGLGPEFSLLANYLADYQGKFADFALNGKLIYRINPKVELNFTGSYGLNDIGGGYEEKKNINFQFSLAYQMINLKNK